MAKLTLTESDQALLRLLSAKQAGAVLHRLLGRDCVLDAGAQEVYQGIALGIEKRAMDAKRKRKILGNSTEIPESFHGVSAECHKITPPFLPPSSFPLTLPLSSPPYNPPTPPPPAGALCADLDAVMSLISKHFDHKVSPISLEKLRVYTEDLGAQVVGLAVCTAIDAGVKKWPYVENILSRCQKHGIRSRADWERHEAEREEAKEKCRMETKTSSKGKHAFAPAQPDPERVQQDLERQERILDTLRGKA